MTNKWILFLKQYASDTNQSYGCALSDPKASVEYNKIKESKKKDDVKNI